MFELGDVLPGFSCPYIPYAGIRNPVFHRQPMNRISGSCSTLPRPMFFSATEHCPDFPYVSFGQFCPTSITAALQSFGVNS